MNSDKFPTTLDRRAATDAPVETSMNSVPPIEPRWRPSLPPAIPGYVIHEKIGHGTYGDVYRATQSALNRAVALKVLKSPDFEGEIAGRFLDEVRTLAELRHPNIVAVFDSGVFDGRAYLALELCEGGSLQDRLKDGRFAPADAARVVAAVARGVHAAHERHVIHRDLKPANILLETTAYPVPVSSKNQEPNFNKNSVWNLVLGSWILPKVCDFGLAKRLDGDQQFTRTGQPIGTPAYMSPEQAGGRSKHVGPAADVWALGAVLYALLTGRPPFLGEDQLDTLRMVVEQEPASVRQLSPDCPRDLEAICLKCLEKDPSRRYASAAALADDLQRFLEGRPVTAKRAGSVERAWKWAKRRPSAAALMAVSVLAPTVLLGVTVAYTIGLQRERDHRTAIVARNYGQNAQRSIDAGDPITALPWLAEALRLDGDRAAIHRHRYAAVAAASPRLRRVIPHPAAILWAEASPDGRFAATACADGTVRVWELVTGRLAGELAGRGPVWRVAYSPNGRRLLAGWGDGTAAAWDAITGKVLREHKHDAAVGLVGFSPDGRRAITVSDTVARSWPIDDGHPVKEMKHDKAITFAGFCCNGKWVVTAGRDAAVKLWPADGQPARAETVETGSPVVQAGWSERSRNFFVGMESGAVATYQAMNSLPAPVPVVSIVTPQPGGSAPVEPLPPGKPGSGLPPWPEDQSTTLVPPAVTPFDPLQSIRLVKLPDMGWPHKDGALALGCSPGGDRVASGGADGQLRLIPVAGPTIRRRQATRWEPSVQTVQGDDGKPRSLEKFQEVVMEITDYSSRLDWKYHAHYVQQTEFSPDGQRLACLGYDRAARVYRADRLECLGGPLPGQDFLTRACFAGDSGTLVTAGHDGLLRVWQFQDAARYRELSGHEGELNRIDFSPDGNHLLTPSDDGTVRQWPLDGGAASVVVQSNVRAMLRFCRNDFGELLLQSEFGSMPFNTAPTWIGPEWPADGPQHGANVQYQVKPAAGRPTVVAGDGEPCVRARWKPRSRQWVGVQADGTIRVADLDRPGWRKEIYFPSQKSSVPKINSGARLRSVIEPWKWLASATIALQDPAQGYAPSLPSAATAGGASSTQSAPGTATAAPTSAGPAAGYSPLDTLREDAAGSADFSPDGRVLITIDLTRTCKIFDADTYQELRQLKLAVGQPRTAAFRPDGRHVVVCGTAGAQVFDRDTGLSLPFTLTHAGGVRRATYSPDGRFIATCGDETARLWDAVTGRPLSPPLKHAGPVYHVEISRDGRKLLSFSPTGARVWSVPDGEPLAPPLSHGDRVATNWAVFHPTNSDVIATAGREDHAARVWTLPPADARPVALIVAEAELLAGRRVDDRGELVPLTAGEIVERFRKLDMVASVK